MRKSDKEKDDMQQLLITNLFLRVKELEELYFEKVGERPPPSSVSLDIAVGGSKSTARSPRKASSKGTKLSGQTSTSSRSAPTLSEEMAALTHPIIENKTARDKKMEVIAATQASCVVEMDKLLNLWLDPMRRSSDLGSDASFDLVFHRYSRLVSLHKSLTRDLESRLAQWVKAGEIIGDVLLRFSGLVKTHLSEGSPTSSGGICSDLDGPLLLEVWKSPSSPVEQWIRQHERQLSSDSSMVPLPVLLSLPRQRLLQLATLADEMASLSASSHPNDRANLVQAAAALQEAGEPSPLSIATSSSSLTGSSSSVSMLASLSSSPPSDLVELPQESGRSTRSSTLGRLTGKKHNSSAPASMQGSSNAPNLRTRLQQSITISFNKVSDGLRMANDRKRSGADMTVASAAAATSSSSGASSTNAPPALPPIESMPFVNAFEKVMDPEGCDEEFENVFLGLHEYFISWSLLITKFSEVYKKALEETDASRKSLLLTRLVQVVSKWLRLNPQLRNARMTAEQIEAEQKDFNDKDKAKAATVASPTIPPLVREDSAGGGLTAMTGSSTSEANLGDDESGEDSDDLSSSATSPPPPALTVENTGEDSTRSSGHRGSLVMGSRKRMSMYNAMAQVSKVLSSDLKLEDLDKHLQDEEEQAATAPLITARSKQMYFVSSMEEWIKTLGDPDVAAMVKYWEQWRFPKKSRFQRRNSVYYRKLQRSKASHFAGAKSTDVMTLSAESLAKQMTLQELNTFKSIPRSEFLNRNFMSAENGSNFQFMVTQFNVWCGWVVGAVLGCDDLQQRAGIVGHLIEIASFCHDMSNFNSSYAIVAGLSHPQVARLKLTWNTVNEASLRKYNRLLEQWDVSGNYRRYRDVLKSVTPPCVPYLGLLGKDLFAIEENSKTMLPGAVINFKKLQLIWSTITFVDSLQQCDYAIEENQQCASFLASVEPTDDATAKTRSHQLEPRSNK